MNDLKRSLHLFLLLQCMSLRMSSREREREIITSQNAHQGPFLPPYSCTNRKCCEMQRSEGILWEFQPSSFVVLSCCILVHICELVGTQECFMKVSVIITHFWAHMSTGENAIMRYDNKAHS